MNMRACSWACGRFLVSGKFTERITADNDVGYEHKQIITEHKAQIHPERIILVRSCKFKIVAFLRSCILKAVL